jgi:hypothetical protein
VNNSLHVVSSYFNWNEYGRKRANVEVFTKKLQADNVPLLMVECALGNRPFALEGEHVIHVRTQSQLWQKERLLNLAARRLPDTCEYVVWMDADLIYPQSGWDQRAEAALQRSDVVQLFSTVIRLPEDNNPENSLARIDRGIVACVRHRGDHILFSRGHPGFAWAARRRFLLEQPLYDGAIVGGADKMMLCAWFGLADCSHMRSIMSEHGFEDFKAWAKRIFPSGESLPRVSYVPGVVHHLWHGEQQNRQYQERYEILKKFDFTPQNDLVVNQDGCWEWRGNKPSLEQAVADYFVARNEDESIREPNCTTDGDPVLPGPELS